MTHFGYGCSNSVLTYVRPLYAVLKQYPWDQQYPLMSIVTLAQGVDVASGGCNASVYSVNWSYNFVISVVAARSSVVSVAFVVDNFPTAWQLDVVTVERFAIAWSWVCSICSRTDAFYCLVAAQMWD